MPYIPTPGFEDGVRATAELKGHLAYVLDRIAQANEANNKGHNYAVEVALYAARIVLEDLRLPR